MFQMLHPRTPVVIGDIKLLFLSVFNERMVFFLCLCVVFGGGVRGSLISRLICKGLYLRNGYFGRKKRHFIFFFNAITSEVNKV